jgi:hypothetical protein
MMQNFGGKNYRIFEGYYCFCFQCLATRENPTHFVLPNFDNEGKSNFRNIDIILLSGTASHPKTLESFFRIIIPYKHIRNPVASLSLPVHQRPVMFEGPILCAKYRQQ